MLDVKGRMLCYLWKGPESEPYQYRASARPDDEEGGSNGSRKRLNLLSFAASIKPQTGRLISRIDNSVYFDRFTKRPLLTSFMQHGHILHVMGLQELRKSYGRVYRSMRQSAGSLRQSSLTGSLAAFWANIVEPNREAFENFVRQQTSDELCSIIYQLTCRRLGIDPHCAQKIGLQLMVRPLTSDEHTPILGMMQASFDIDLYTGETLTVKPWNRTVLRPPDSLYEVVKINAQDVAENEKPCYRIVGVWVPTISIESERIPEDHDGYII